MRRKINYQVPEYIKDNELICFGLSSHEVEEREFNWTPQAEKDLAIVRGILSFNYDVSLMMITVPNLILCFGIDENLVPSQ